MKRLRARKLGDQPALALVERARPKAVAVAGARDRLGRPFLEQGELGQKTAPGVGRGTGAFEPPIDLAAAAQHAIDVLRDGGAILHAGEAMAAEILGDEVVGRRAFRADRIEESDRGFDSCARRHEEKLSAAGLQRSAIPISSCPDLFRASTSKRTWIAGTSPAMTN